MKSNTLTSESWTILGLVLTPILLLGLILMCIICCNCICHNEEEEVPIHHEPCLIPNQKKRSSSVKFLDRADSEKFAEAVTNRKKEKATDV